MTTATETAMAKRNDVSVKMDAGTVEFARLAATYQGKSLAEYLSEIVLPIARRDADAGHAKLFKEPPPKKRPR